VVSRGKEEIEKMKCSDKWMREQAEQKKEFCEKEIALTEKIKKNISNAEVVNASYRAELEAMKWFLGLLDEREAELREIIEECEKQPIQGQNVKIHLQSRKETFKEVLGVDE